MRRTMGWLLVVHGLAHAAPGMWASALGPAWLVTPLWAAATLGITAGGFGLLGAYGLRRWWEHLAIGGTLASLLLLLLFGRTILLAGMVLDVAFLLTGLRAGESNLMQGFLRREPVPARSHPAHSAWGVIGTSLAVALLAWTGIAIVARPWHTRWGATDAERIAPLPGDRTVAARYRIDHAITVRAPSEAVAPGRARRDAQRSGAATFDRLERLLGAESHVAVEPMDRATSRVHVRTRGEGVPSAAGVAGGPVALLLLEPAHFVLERGMLRGIKARAEGVRN